MKTCSKCAFPKDENCFYNGKSWCIECHKKRNNAYYETNKETIIERVKQYYTDNKSAILEQKKQYFAENKDDILEKQHLYYEENFDIIQINRREYRISHKEERNKYQKHRYNTDPEFRLRVLLSTSILKFLKKSSSSKDDSVTKYFSYSVDELKAHLEKQFEPWMNWDNQGKYNIETWDDNDPATWTWQIDHIIPHSKLPYTTMTDENFQKCWALDNLRPLSAKQNNKDGNRR